MTLTADQGGTRTIRALSELDDAGLRQDAAITYGPDRPSIEFRVHGPHKAFVKLRWDHLKATDKLTALS